ncbi:MAG: hypothetical protein JWM53_6425 [bacterium]|nr:hypothetical protein [bacterium]
MKHPSGAAGRFRRRLFDEALPTGVELGAFSAGFADHVRRYGLSQDTVIGYVNAVRGRQRRLEPGEVQQNRELDEVEARLDRLTKRRAARQET